MNRETRRKTHKIRNEDIDVIKIEALREFLSYIWTQNLWKRLIFAVRVIFKRFPTSKPDTGSRAT